MGTLCECWLARGLQQVLQDCSKGCHECWLRFVKLLVKLFDANELITSVKIENMSLFEKVKSLESELYDAREQLYRTLASKLDSMLNVQKSISD